jgi:hypothetical protein
LRSIEVQLPLVRFFGFLVHARDDYPDMRLRLDPFFHREKDLSELSGFYGSSDAWYCIDGSGKHGYSFFGFL